MSYAPINNILVVKGKMDETTKNTIETKVAEVSIEGVNCIEDADHDEVWLYYTTNGTPCEKEVETTIKAAYPQLRFFFSSTDFDGFEWNYYKELGSETEHPYGTGRVEDMKEILTKFVRQ